jgi:MFS family permease
MSTVEAAPAPDAGETTPQRRPGFSWRFVTPLYMGSALNPINSTAIATGLVAIAAAMGVPVGRTAILVSVLYLTCTVAQPTAGKLSEELGPRRVYLAGIMILLLGGIVGGLGQNLATLVVARILIGVGTSAGYPSAMVLIRRRAAAAGLSEPPGNVLGGLAIAGQVTVAIGPTIGGLLIGWFDWRAAFLLNIPIALLALAMATFWLPKDEPVATGRGLRDILARIDLIGIIGFGAAMTALLVFLLSLPSPDWIALGLSILCGATLVAWELRAGRPFIDMRLLASNGALTRTYLRSSLTLVGVYVILYGLTQWIEAARGLSAEEAGLVLIPMGAIAALISRPISRRNLVRGPLIVSAVFLLLGALATLFLTHTSPIIAIIGVSVLFGITTGATSVANQTALYREAPADVVGTASGLLRTFSYVGSIAAATITGIAFRTRVSDGGLHAMSYILLGVGLVVLLLTVFDRRLGARPTSA